MSTEPLQLSDNEFIRQFEQTTLDQKYFDHVGHLRIAWLYLSHYSFESSVERICEGIQAYAHSLGARDKYHATISTFLTYVIHARMSENDDTCWHDFIARNSDLVEDCMILLRQYYTEQHLMSHCAKVTYVEPDLKPLSEVNRVYCR